MDIRKLFIEAIISGLIYKISSGEMPNIPFKTLGGLVFWDTTEECNGWRLQKHEFTGHYRILDSNNIRRAWGSEKEMEGLLKKLA